MGRGRNWQRFATELVQRKPDIEAVLVDLRLHGESQGFDPPHTVRACGEDVVGAIHELPLQNEKSDRWTFVRREGGSGSCATRS
ncbi:MAG: hypothetical protein IPJ69_12345 [Deltaproteobacteria bacterium]|nr:MAG: hypothetical protein IPJ69_12345 [Deltaproteobacteria bacterium]